MQVPRREFLKLGAMSAVLAGCSRERGPQLQLLQYSGAVDNPLAHYPSRDWEKLYRDVERYDSVFHFLCAPNDTHNCLLRAYVKNGVITRLGPSFGYGQAKDVYGNQASARWDPRCCQKRLALLRRVYGPRRCKAPMVRKGFLEWSRSGFPRNADGSVAPRYLNRGKDDWVKVGWDQAFDLVARGLLNIAKTYNGAEGAARLRGQGYDPAMIEAMKGHGTQVLKLRGGMPLLGATRIMSLFRFGNGLALLDAHLNKTGPQDSLGARLWDSYSWHTDLPPGHPMVTGQQTVDFDLVDAENAGLIIPWGMNWISTKMPDGHWLTEARLKGARVVSVTVEYSSVVSKSDEAVIIRPGSDTAFALGLATS